MKRSSDSPSAGATRRAVERRLRAARLAYGHGTQDAREEAAWIVAHAARLRFDDVASRLAPRTLGRIDRLVAMRIDTRAPLAYLLREAWLCGTRFHVDRRVIVPRSFIAALLAERLAPWVRAPGRVRDVLDLCTGSGCLAILAARAFPHAHVDAVDVSRAALAVAERNIRAHRLRQRVRAIRSDLFATLAERRYNLIIANPPYVTARSMARLPPEYRAEPRLALAGGADGLDIVRRIVAGARARLQRRGLLVAEIGRGRRAVERAFPQLAFTWLGESIFLLEREQLA